MILLFDKDNYFLIGQQYCKTYLWLLWACQLNMSIINLKAVNL